MLLESVYTTDIECENGSTSACGVDDIDEIFAPADACNGNSSQSPRDEQNETEMIKCFNNEARLLTNTNLCKCGTSKQNPILNALLILLLLSQLLKPALKEFIGFKVPST